MEIECRFKTITENNIVYYHIKIDVTCMEIECCIKTMTKIMSCTITLREMSQGWRIGKQMYDVTAWRWNVACRKLLKQCLVLSH